MGTTFRSADLRLDRDGKSLAIGDRVKWADGRADPIYGLGTVTGFATVGEKPHSDACDGIVLVQWDDRTHSIRRHAHDLVAIFDPLAEEYGVTELDKLRRKADALQAIVTLVCNDAAHAIRVAEKLEEEWTETAKGYEGGEHEYLCGYYRSSAAGAHRAAQRAQQRLDMVLREVEKVRDDG